MARRLEFEFSALTSLLTGPPRCFLLLVCEPPGWYTLSRVWAASRYFIRIALTPSHQGALLTKSSLVQAKRHELKVTREACPVFPLFLPLSFPLLSLFPFRNGSFSFQFWGSCITLADYSVLCAVRVGWFGERFYPLEKRRKRLVWRSAQRAEGMRVIEGEPAYGDGL